VHVPLGDLEVETLEDFAVADVGVKILDAEAHEI
jgi:hypothetical protein